MATINDACYAFNYALSAVTGGSEPGRSLPTANAKTFQAVLDSQARAAARGNGIKIEAVQGRASSKSGSNTAYNVYFYKDGCGDTLVAKTGCYDVCSSENSVGPSSAEVEKIHLSKNIGIDFSIAECDFDDSCDTVARALQAKLTKFRQEALKQLNNDAIAHIVAAAGNYYWNGVEPVSAVNSITDPRTVKLFATDGRTPQPESIYTLDAEFIDRQGQLSYTWVGQSKTNAYGKISGLWTGNTDGFDASKSAPISGSMSYDSNIGIVTGNTDDALAFADGYMHFIPKVDFGAKPIDRNGRKSYTMDLLPGVPVDITVKEVDCGKYMEYVYTIQMDYNFWNPGSDFFSESCLEYHNGILLYKEGCADSVCTDLELL